MKAPLDKIGSAGGVIAAAACPICLPKLAAIGAICGLGALGSYESELFIAAQLPKSLSKGDTHVVPQVFAR